MRLIDADELRKHAFWECYDNPDYDYQYVTIDQINYAPTIDAEPVKHGRWVEDEDGFLICSECGNTAAYLILGQIETPYCSECGARMDEVEE